MEIEKMEKSNDILKNDVDDKPESVLSEVNTSINVPIPSKKPFINFIQDFVSKHKGDEVTATVMVNLAKAKWRKLSNQEKQIYIETKKDKQSEVDAIRRQVKSRSNSDYVHDSD